MNSNWKALVYTSICCLFLGIAACSDTGYFSPKSSSETTSNSSTSSDNSDSADSENSENDESITPPVWINGSYLTCEWLGLDEASTLNIGCNFYAHQDDNADSLNEFEIEWGVVDRAKNPIDVSFKPSSSGNINSVSIPIDAGQIASAKVIATVVFEEDEQRFELLFTDALSGFENGELEKCFEDNQKTTELCLVEAGILDPSTKAIGLICPKNYILIDQNGQAGSQKEFCVAKYEMSLVGPEMYSSEPFNTPAGSITTTVAQAGCKSIGSAFALISNPEWMAIAYKIESIDANWSSGAVGQGRLNQGHTDGVPNSPIPAAVLDNDSCFGTGEQCSIGEWSNQRRTFAVGNDEVIWDFAGNLAEIVDWTVKDNKATLEPTEANSFFELVDLPETITMPNASFKPGNKSLTHANNNIGLIKPGIEGVEGQARRGGSFGASGAAGIYSLRLQNLIVIESRKIGFRCVYRP